jgi:hypothetical protein
MILTASGSKTDSGRGEAAAGDIHLRPRTAALALAPLMPVSLFVLAGPSGRPTVDACHTSME